MPSMCYKSPCEWAVPVETFFLEISHLLNNLYAEIDTNNKG